MGQKDEGGYEVLDSRTESDMSQMAFTRCSGKDTGAFDADEIAASDNHYLI